jgi:hypothetical protein
MLARLRVRVEHQIESQHGEQETGACRGECLPIGTLPSRL